VLTASIAVSTGPCASGSTAVAPQRYGLFVSHSVARYDLRLGREKASPVLVGTWLRGEMAQPRGVADVSLRTRTDQGLWLEM
jgi:hypothetical protein